MPRSPPGCSSRFAPWRVTFPRCCASSRWPTGAPWRFAATRIPAPATCRAGRGPRSPRRCPSPLTSFVGRVAERAALADALDAHRLVTAVGPGGVGKTRLALSVAADVADRFADGVWFVDLVPVTDPSMVAPAMADALGLGEHQGRSAEDSAELAGRPGDAAGAGQLRARAGRRGGPAGTAARRQSRGCGARHQPGPVAGAVRMGVPGARAVPGGGRRRPG